MQFKLRKLWKIRKYIIFLDRKHSQKSFRNGWKSKLYANWCDATRHKATKICNIMGIKWFPTLIVITNSQQTFEMHRLVCLFGFWRLAHAPNIPTESDLNRVTFLTETFCYRLLWTDSTNLRPQPVICNYTCHIYQA